MLVKKVLDSGGSIHPLIIPSELTNGTGLCNPSVYIDNGKVLVNIRHVEYNLYHSEFTQKFPSRWGPLTYMHPEDYLTLRTVNYLAELDENYDIKWFHRVDTSLLDQSPRWEFIGLEDGRLFRWDDKLYLCGVRRDTTPNGQGRMEFSELDVTEDYVKEVKRFRIEPPNNPDSYCEKNWMPVIDQPFTFVKWSNPTEVVTVDLENLSSKSIVMSDKYFKIPRDLRGSSHVVTLENYHIAITHEVDLWHNEVGSKDSQYYHRFIVWDKDWNLVRFTEPFKFMDGYVEFCTGLALHGNDFLITFGFQDNAAYILRAPANMLIEFIKNE